MKKGREKEIERRGKDRILVVAMDMKQQQSNGVSGFSSRKKKDERAELACAVCVIE